MKKIDSLTPAQKQELMKKLAAARSTRPAGPALVAVPRDRELPLSFVQQRLWFLDQLDPSNRAYNLASRYRLRGPLDVAALRAAFDGLIARHEALRTVFPSVNGVPHTEIRPPSAFELVVEDAPDAARRADELALAGFDLAAGPLIRARLLRLAPDDHVLALEVHHIVFDGWSTGVLWRELAALYRGETLPPLAVQYADYAVWVRKWLTGDTLERQLAYWRQTLAEAPNDLALPMRGPRPPIQTFRGGRIELELAPEVTQALRRLATERGATLFMIFLGALRILLARYTNQRELCVGTNIANRGKRELEDLIGFFTTTVVLRGEVRGGERFVDLLEREKQVVLAAAANQDAPFEQIVDALGLERTVDRMPLIQVMCVDQGPVVGEGELPGLATEPFRTELELEPWDLAVESFERAGRREIKLGYNADLFDRDTMATLAARYLQLLTEISVRPEAQIATLLADRVEAAPIEWDCAGDVVQRIEATMRAVPDAPALVGHGGTLSYRELDLQSARLAALLRDRGVGPEHTVAVLAERGHQQIIAIVAVLRAGGAYVPIKPDLPDERIAWLLADTAPTVILSEGPLTGERVIRLGEPLPERALAPIAVPPDALAYVIYTSGSTGRPKGVMVSRRAFAAQMRWIQDQFPLAGDDRCLQLHSFTFDASVSEIFWPLISGGAIVLPRPRGELESEYLDALIVETRTTVVHAVPSMLAVLLATLDPPKWAHVERVVAGGEALTVELAQRFMHALPHVELLNTYGPTETTVNATFVRVAAGPIAIGRAVANTTLYVLDPDLAPVPPGGLGELWIGGVQLARGYSNRPELTAERFIPDPFSSRAGERMYRTSDLVRQRSDGQLDYVGRSDFQVKVRGFRIELGEISAVLAEHRDVRAAVVIVRDNALVAYAVASAPVAELRDHLARRLPEYMVPSAIILLDALPLTAGGKLDRKALPAPGEDAFARVEHVAPRTPAEQALARVWCEVLGISRVGIHDNFFALGGHSLLAVQLIAKLRRELEAELALGDLFATPTIAQLADRLRTTAKRDPVTRLARTEGVAGLLQPYWWAVHEDDPSKGAPLPRGRRRRGIVPELWHFRGPLDPAALARAVRELGTRHEILRTNYRRVDDVIERGLRQIVRPAEPRYLPGFAYHEHEVDLHELATRPFDLADGPMVRFDVIRLAADHHAVMMQVHHIVSDGPSDAIIRQELAASYRGELVSPPALQFLDVAEYLDAYRATPAGIADLDYWRREAELSEPLELPIDFSRAEIDAEVMARRAATGRQFTAYFPTEIARATDPQLATLVAEAARRENVTLLVIALAAMARLLHEETGQTVISLQTSLNIRPLLGTEALIGGFNSVIALRLDLSRPDLLHQTRDAFAQAYAHALISSLEIIPAAAGRVNLGLWGAVGPGPTFRLGDAIEVPAPAIESAFDLAFDLAPNVAIDGERLSIAIAFNTRLFQRATVERLCARYLEVLRAIAR